MSTIPKAYQAATPDPDARAILSIARRLWEQLPKAERELLGATDNGWLTRGRKRDRARLLTRGFAQGDGGLRLTPLGALVREAGQAAGGAR